MTTSRKILTSKEIVEDIRSENGTVVQQLTLLVERFNIAARAIDPTITGSWVGYETERPGHACYIAFERGKPLFGVGIKR
jgi:hypothetical protein